MELKTELEILKKTVDDLRDEVRSGFQVITKKIGEIYDRLEERNVQDGKQDIQLEHHDQLLTELYAKTETLAEKYHEVDNKIEQKHGMYVKWLAGLTISLITLILVLIEHLVG